MSYLIDVLSSQGHISVNKVLAKLTNLVVAGYWAELLEIAYTNIQNKTYDTSNGSIMLDREKIKEDIGLEPASQYTCDKCLADLGILEINKSNADNVIVNITNYVCMLSCKNLPEMIDTYEKKSNKKRTESENKKYYAYQKIKEGIVEPDSDINKALCNLIDSIYESGKSYASKQIITTFQNTINSFTNDKEVKLELIKIAMLNNLNNASYAIERYNKQHNKTTPQNFNKNTHTEIVEHGGIDLTTTY